MKDAFEKAGLRQSGRLPTNAPRGNQARGPARQGPGNPFPPGYPRYFSNDGHTRVELLTTEAQQIARTFAKSLAPHQLRSFYGHAKRQLQRLDYGAPFGEILPEIARLKAFAADRAARRQSPVPQAFKSFIDRNVDTATDEKAFRKGFMPHFEAVVAYSRTEEQRT